MPYRTYSRASLGTPLTGQTGFLALISLDIVTTQVQSSGTIAINALVGVRGRDTVAPNTPTRRFPLIAVSLTLARNWCHYFTQLNSNKKSLALHTKTPEGKAILEKLIQRADVFVENVGSGVMDRMDFSQ